MTPYTKLTVCAALFIALLVGEFFSVRNGQNFVRVYHGVVWQYQVSIANLNPSPFLNLSSSQIESMQ